MILTKSFTAGSFTGAVNSQRNVCFCFRNAFQQSFEYHETKDKLDFVAGSPKRLRICRWNGFCLNVLSPKWRYPQRLDLRFWRSIFCRFIRCLSICQTRMRRDKMKEATSSFVVSTITLIGDLSASYVTWNFRSVSVIPLVTNTNNTDFRSSELAKKFNYYE